MSIKDLERVMWRLRVRNINQPKVTNKELKRVIMMELGTSPQTYYRNRKALMDLGWIRSWKTQKIILTNNDITGEY